MAGRKRYSKFRVNQHVVYPSHGVGKIVAVENRTIGGEEHELYVISISKEKLTLRVPTAKARETGVRGLATADEISKALDTLKGRAQVKRAMWSRRAQEYDQKINSGVLQNIAEVVRDLHRGDDQREQSFSERQLYESALDRLSREIAAVEGVDLSIALKRVSDVLDTRSSRS
ncbi:MAG: CarD family transcriptional regulator [Albidovulum sp.]|nr:CarD family transcriptional regulator [Albidovulum sp.]MDE0305613.1 CarD family transcriptional regulator [Albidovulum sp.]MDE0533665.1 CarD family transcriptional regulator [Albidovulum sp.]